jgi:hypothetical protein
MKTPDKNTSTKSSKLRIINNSQIYITIIDPMDQTFLVGIVLLEEIGVPEENHEPAASAGFLKLYHS